MGAKSVLVGIASVLLLGLGAGSAEAAAKAAPSCSRACLEDIAGKYFAAVVAHDARQLPLAKGAVYVENNIKLKMNDGLWATAESIDPYKVWVTDEKSHQVLVFTGVKEQNVMAFLAVRLKTQGRQVTEVETSVVRKYAGAQGNYDVANLGAPAPVWAASMPAEKKSSRAVMTKVANLYFDGIEQSNGTIVPFINGECLRFENHVQTAGRRPANPAPGTGGEVAPNRPYETCAAQFSSGRFHYINKISNRRCDIDDETRGIAICIVHFQHPGTVHFWTDKATGQQNPIGGNFAKYPNTTYIWEAFKVENGKYNDILAYVNVVPYRMTSPFKR